MVNRLELYARIKEEVRFSWEEVSGLIIAINISAFIFNYCGWGPSYSCNINDFDLAL